mgnify:CR=1 FL=1
MHQKFLSWWKDSKNLNNYFASLMIAVSILGAGAIGVGLRPFFNYPLLSLHSSTVIPAQESPKILVKRPEKPLGQEQEADGWVLGETTPSIGIVATDYPRGGIIPFTIYSDPVVTLQTNNIVGEVQFQLFKITPDLAKDYLLYDGEGNRAITELKFEEYEEVANFTKTVEKNTKVSAISLPLESEGLWYLHASQDGVSGEAIIVRSSVSATLQEGDNEYIFWAYDHQTKKSKSDAKIELWSLKETPRQLGSTITNQMGVATHQLDPIADLAFVYSGESIAILPINLEYSRYSDYYLRFHRENPSNKYFIFTDRPIYQPGDMVFYKVISRVDDDAVYSLPTEQAKLDISQSYSDDESIYQRDLSFNEYGSADGSFQLPKEGGATGLYYISVSPKSEESQADQDYYSGSAYFSFDVQHYRKPDYTLNVDSNESVFVRGDIISFEIDGNYFSGQPLMGAEVTYELKRSTYPYYWRSLNTEYLFLGYDSEQVDSGTVNLDSKGKATVEIKADYHSGDNNVYQLTAKYVDAAGNRAVAYKNVLVFAGEFDMFHQLGYYSSHVINEEISLPIELVPRVSGAQLANRVVSVKLTRHWWEKRYVDDQKYPIYDQLDEQVLEFNKNTDESGKITLSHTPKSGGLYKWELTTQDAKGNEITKTINTYVREEGVIYREQSPASISISPDKDEYVPGETAWLTISSEIPDRDVFVSYERNRVRSYQTIHVSGNQTTIAYTLSNTDMPNIFVKAASFSDYQHESTISDLTVSANQQRLVVEIKPDKEQYAPGEEVELSIFAHDQENNPLVAELGVWLVDKAIFELARSNTGDIFESYWRKRYHNTVSAHSLEGVGSMAEMGGCFATGTKVSMADGLSKNIEDVAIGDKILTKARDTGGQLVEATVLNTHQAEVDGYYIINRDLRVTGNHLVYASGEFRRVDTLKIGDEMLGSGDEIIKVDSLEWLAGKFMTYNLSVENYQTYFANDYYVHNEKGGIDAREKFEDTAYWNPRVITNEQGQAKVSFKLPDNLTTWVVASLGATKDTRVGQAETELVVTKDVIVRPVMPNILHQGDEAYLSALVHNFSGEDLWFNVSLEAEVGEVENPEQEIFVTKDGLEQVFWKVTQFNSSTEEAEFTFSAQAIAGDSQHLSDEDEQRLTKYQDAIINKIPINSVGVERTQAYSGSGSKEYELFLSPKANLEKSYAELTISPTRFGSVQSAMKYLVGYPYGCNEQVTSRLIPPLLAKRHSSLFVDILNRYDEDKLIDESIERLRSSQREDGGWSWWRGDSDLYTSVYVVSALKQAQDLGFDVERLLLDSQSFFLSNLNEHNPQDYILASYGLSIVDPSAERGELTAEGINQDIESEFLAMAILADVNNGVASSTKLNWLTAKAQVQGNTVFWTGSSDKYSNSPEEIATAMAVKAILSAGGDRQLAEKGVDHLVNLRDARAYNYWSNTYTTVQVVLAVEALAQTGRELNPDYSYQVLIDGELWKQGQVDSIEQVVTLDLPVDLFESSAGSRVDILQEGQGQMYSNLLFSEFVEDHQLPAEGHGISITREYQSSKGPGYNIAVGDEVIVRLIVSGLNKISSYGVIEDHLPAGMIPINTNLLNEQQTSSYGYWWSTDDYTKDGAILSLPSIPVSGGIYTYRARAVNPGLFWAPPAKVSLMYSPEINAHTGVELIEISANSEYFGQSNVGINRQTDSPTWVQIITYWLLRILVGMLTISVIVVAYLFLKEQNKRKKEGESLVNLSSILDSLKELFFHRKVQPDFNNNELDNEEEEIDQDQKDTE